MTERDRAVRRCAAQDKFLARAADMLNQSTQSAEMELGAEITDFRRRALDLPLTSAREVTDEMVEAGYQAACDVLEQPPCMLSEDADEPGEADLYADLHKAVSAAIKAALASAPQPACVGVGEVDRLRAALIPLAKQSDFYKPEVPFYEQVSVPLAYLRAAREAVPGELPPIEDILDGHSLSPAPSPQAGGGIDFADLQDAPRRNAQWLPPLQDLVYDAINWSCEDYSDADEDAGQQFVERLLIALRNALSPRRQG